MKLLVKKLCLFVHRVLCYISIHAPERIFLLEDDSQDFKPDGWFCAVCTKTWEEN